jgi:hypothetical protein
MCWLNAFNTPADRNSILVRELGCADSSEYIPRLGWGTQVRLLKRDHRDSGRTGTIIRVLANPSRLSQHQWYDVKFENGRLGRFLEPDLERAGTVK